MTIARSVIAALALAMVLIGGVAPAGASPAGHVTWGVHVSLAPSWFDPAEAPGTITPYMFFYALHDAMLKPMPGVALAPSLAESWTVIPDEATRAAALKRGDVDISYVARGPITEDLQRTKGLTLKPTIIQATWWVYFADQLVHDKAMFIPIWENAVLTGVGPRVEESALGLVAGQPWSVPYEEVKLKAK